MSELKRGRRVRASVKKRMIAALLPAFLLLSAAGCGGAPRRKRMPGRPAQHLRARRIIPTVPPSYPEVPAESAAIITMTPSPAPGGTAVPIPTGEAVYSVAAEYNPVWPCRQRAGPLLI
jgi:hypothetical protein